jgi:hypothetical protein
MHTVGVNLISNQDLEFNGKLVNVHHIRSVVVEDGYIYNVVLDAQSVLDWRKDEPNAYWYFRNRRIVGDLKRTEKSLGTGNGYSYLLSDRQEASYRCKMQKVLGSVGLLKHSV